MKQFTLHGKFYPYHEERRPFNMRKATLYNEYEHVGQLDWLEFGDCVFLSMPRKVVY